ncbi:MAG: serine O-acetyltransferase [Hyphomicrobium zavarzinii]|jgi:serine O-acetyltransferase|uniref:serine O-acetyltransferase n=1 Tax=Hyphomicrobium TaxID=81 RepID=UPI000367B004|nr:MULTISPECIES: serine O-acetyltransferase [Hyphomicrobium]MBL8846365.1 serine O-acetyltransferase [Hyphomicrobium zavarzinii]WBT36640.1 serine O-acetyltransferase [Hyphomicrobium sp. DMF-1]
MSGAKHSSLAGKTERRTAPNRAAEDPIWASLRSEAEAAMAAEPALTGFIYATVASHDNLEEAICHRIAQRLGHADVDAPLIVQIFRDVLASQPALGQAFRADLAAVFDRDPACTRYLEPFLYFKGFHALVTYRFAHELWRQGRRDFALYMQSQSSRMFAVDIHPAARLGKGLMFDHATGVVIGETATVGDDCSLLHAVTLGGSGKQTGDRHPKIGSCVLIGAGAKVLGNIHVGNCSRIAAGSVVLADVPPHVTVAGVPARVVGPAGTAEPGRTMDQTFVPVDSLMGPDDYAML